MSKQIFKFRSVLSLATLSACVLTFAPAAQAGLLGGATGNVGGTLSPRNLDLNGQGRANVARDGTAQLPRGEKLRDAAGNATGEAKGSVGAAKDAATDKAAQAQGAATGTAKAGTSAATEKAAEVKNGSGEAAATATASKSVGKASAGGTGSASAKREGRSVNATASGDGSVSVSR